MKQSESITDLANALVAVQTELRGVAKDSTNPDVRSSYASLDAIIAASRPVLTKHGLAIVQGATTPHSDESGRIAAVAVETMLVHVSGQWIMNTAIMPVVGRMLKGGGRADPDPQAGGSALTYGRRYGLAAILCLAADEDDDGRAARPKAAPKAKPAATPAPISPVMTIGKHKGQPVASLDTDTLKSALAWCLENGQEKFADLIAHIEIELEGRN